MKKIVSLLVALTLIFSAVSTLAANVGMNNFKVKNTYNATVYSDVDSNKWYNGSVKKCYELALMLGNGGGKFNPEGNVTLAEVLTMASRVHNIYNGGDGTLDTSVGNVWYDGIVKYATEKGIIKTGEFEGFERAATRAEMAYVFANSMPESEFNIINQSVTVPDVKQTDKYSAVIMKLYKAGIVVGSDEKHSFFPNSNITRAEAAAIICRVVDKTERIKLETEKPETNGNASTTEPDEEDEYIPEDDEEYIPEDDEDYIPEDDIYDEEVTDEGLFEDVTEVVWKGALDDSMGPTRRYTANYKLNNDQIYFSMQGSFADQELDMSKVRIGFATVEWISEDLSFIGYDVTLKGQYTKCASEKELDSPGEYYLFEKKLEGVDCTVVKINFAEVDAEEIRNIENFEKAGTNDVNQFVFAAADGWYSGSEATYVIIDKLFAVVTVNNYDSNNDLSYYVGDDGYNTTASDMEAVLLFDDKILILMSCESITFENEDGKTTVEITKEVLENGVDIA